MVGEHASGPSEDANSHDSLGHRTLEEPSSDLDQPYERTRAARAPIRRRDRRCVFDQVADLMASSGASAAALAFHEGARARHLERCTR